VKFTDKVAIQTKKWLTNELLINVKYIQITNLQNKQSAIKVSAVEDIDFYVRRLVI
jgi:hypothetical protein